MASNRELIDRLNKMSDADRERMRRAANAAAATPNPLGLRYVTGARVLDVTSGLGGLITEARRDPASVGGLYTVRLSDARVVYRVDTEIEPDPEPAPAAR